MPIGFGGAFGSALDDNPGIVEEYVEAAQNCYCLFHAALAIFQLRVVGRDKERLPTGSTDFCHECFAQVGATSRKGNLSPGFGKHLNSGFTNA